MMQIAGLLALLLAVVACGPLDGANSYKVGIGGQYSGEAVCREYPGTRFLSCDVKRIPGDGEILVEGIYYRFANTNLESGIAAALSIGTSEYAPELRLMLPQNAKRAAMDDALAPLDRSELEEIAALVCRVLLDFGGSQADCNVRDDSRLISIRMRGGEDDCQVLADVSDQLLSVRLENDCDSALWRAAHLNLLSDVGRLEEWYITQTRLE